ncbi:Stk1 family PASTA domain-containing Ser/Thr kinase [Ructibacterium gallinarum]|uniref:non-specific serine/threonine protein kinase n=1 Tax=Ructibacterium gallinarum TaxID=2779355 RepID=A0A9D5M2R2_9FIRM|nr:Stk1 family PASTA domain-containing Ser/Thr kinase [Ructibacterium gallinarum]MBE5039545.1 Stk1 family PASTA domain-containing Ser/Thr kinase [Ructibacterium gallinarum]
MDLVGKVLAGRYEIREEIGKGGMAQVYKAWCNVLNRYVAIKVLKEEFKDDKEFVHRFNVEAQAAAGISNPHVVSIYDVGFENGLYYIVMEYVEGITLKEYIAEKGRLPWREAAGFAAQICEGLEAAHKNHVIHRDIKPQNIIMTPDGVLKVTDFGIARATTQATMTMGNNAIGTVHYLSPEQARGGYTDERTDIYSLGVVLYEMLTGRLPFNDDSPVAVAIKHIQESPTPLRELNPDIPEAMEKITLRAMNKEQNVRYPSAEAFLKDLNRVLINPDYQMESQERSDIQDGEDMDTTMKMPSIGENDIEHYRKNHPENNQKKSRNETGGYADYAQKVDQAVEERKLREIDEKRARREQKKKERRVTMIAILTAILVVAGLGAVFAGVTGGLDFLKGGETVEIPKLVDMDLEKAQHQYKDTFSIVKKSEKPSDKAAGAILEQSPEAGTKVQKREDIIIYVVVSAGNTAVNLENYVGKNITEASNALKESGFQVNIIEKYSDSEAKDTVMAQDPAAGTAVSPGGLVTLYVSKGSEDEKPSASASTKPTNTPSATKKPESTVTETPDRTERPTQRPEKTVAPTKTPETSGGSGQTGGSGSGNGGTESEESGSGTGGGNTNTAPGIGD